MSYTTSSSCQLTTFTYTGDPPPPTHTLGTTRQDTDITPTHTYTISVTDRHGQDAARVHGVHGHQTVRTL